MRESRAQALTTLAGAAAKIIGTNIPILERFRMLKAEVYASVTGLTAGEGMGLILGLADGDLNQTEIEAIIEATLPLGPNDIEGSQIAERPVWFLGSTNPREGDTQTMLYNDTGGFNMEIKPRWTFARDKSWNWFIYNLGGTLTTGSTVGIRVKEFGVWVL